MTARRVNLDPNWSLPKSAKSRVRRERFPHVVLFINGSGRHRYDVCLRCVVPHAHLD